MCREGKASPSSHFISIIPHTFSCCRLPSWKLRTRPEPKQPPQLSLTLVSSYEQVSMTWLPFPDLPSVNSLPGQCFYPNQKILPFAALVRLGCSLPPHKLLPFQKGNLPGDFSIYQSSDLLCATVLKNSLLDNLRELVPIKFYSDSLLCFILLQKKYFSTTVSRPFAEMFLFVCT